MMCFKKKPVSPVFGEKTFLGFGINKYGGGNDLNGCVNDINDAEKKLISLFPEIQTAKFLDKEAKKDTFRFMLASAIEALPKDGTVVLITDCCFSGSITKSMVIKKKARFKPSGILPNMGKIKRLAKSDTAKWVTISGCGERQTSADALINGRYNGAFTYVALNLLKKGMTYRQWFDKIREQLPSATFEQAPTIEGFEYLVSRVVGDGPTLIVWYSGHGTYVKDRSGDEADGYDEALCLYDGNLVDDDLNYILRTIK
jgi:hypothetical protein